MARTQSAALDRKKLMADPIMVTTIVVLIAFLTLFNVPSSSSNCFAFDCPIPLIFSTRFE